MDDKIFSNFGEMFLDLSDFFMCGNCIFCRVSISSRAEENFEEWTKKGQDFVRSIQYLSVSVEIFGSLANNF